MISPPMISAYHRNEQNWRKEKSRQCKILVKIEGLTLYRGTRAINQIMHIAGVWMPEKSFATTPYLCHDEIPYVHINLKSSIGGFIMASNKVTSKLKDFEGIHAPAYNNTLHFFWVNKCPHVSDEMYVRGRTAFTSHNKTRI
jgi:hypothetical protein